MTFGYRTQPTILDELHFQPILGATTLTVAIPNIGSMFFFQNYNLLHHMPQEQHRKGFFHISRYLFFEFINYLITCTPFSTCTLLLIGYYATQPNPRPKSTLLPLLELLLKMFLTDSRVLTELQHTMSGTIRNSCK